MVSRGRPAIWASALVVAAIQVAGSFGAASNQPERAGIDALAIALLLVGPLALAVRDRWPVAAVAVSLAAVDVWIALGYAYGPIFLSPIVALVTAVLMGHRRDTWVVAGLGYLGLLVAGQIDPNAQGNQWIAPVVIAAWLIVVLALAEVARGRRDEIIERRRAAEVEQQRKLDEQRLDLARELHDVLAHTISLINVQASVALHLLDEQPERARPALAEIKQHSSEALRELRTALDVLRRGDDAPRAPAPRLADLPSLVDAVRASGLDVGFEQDGDVGPLPPATELAAYRIVQEALTNVTRHADARHAVVRLHHDVGGVHLEVVDDGRGVPDRPVTPGRGLTGMRERAVAVGGHIEVGPAVGGGFRVAADLPAGSAATTGSADVEHGVETEVEPGVEQGVAHEEAR